MIQVFQRSLSCFISFDLSILMDYPFSICNVIHDDILLFAISKILECSSFYFFTFFLSTFNNFIARMNKI